MSVYYDPKESPERRLLRGLIFFVIGLLMGLISWAVKGQEIPSTIRALQKGAPVPDLTLSNLVNTKDPAEAIRITGSDDKLTVLIFFGTWCGSCRAEFPSHQALQNRFSKEMQLIIVSDESRAKLASFFQTARYTDGTPYSFPCVAEDKYLKALFPHRFIPHLVWIKSGRVAAVTSGEELTAENITTVLNGSTPPYQKEDLDPGKPLFFTDRLPPTASYSLFIKGRIDGLSSGSTLRKSGDLVYGRLIHNDYPKWMYEIAAMELIPEYTPKRLFLSVRDSSSFIPPAKPSLSFLRENLCTYELRVPLNNADSLYRYMLKDLNRYTAFEGVVEQRMVKAYVLTVLRGKEGKLKTKGGKSQVSLFNGNTPKMINYPTKILVLRLNELEYLPFPVIDETGITSNIDLTFSSSPGSLTELQSALLEQGLKLSLKERKLDMLCIRDDK